ncbi:MAG TPA: phosphoribosyltransferase family protein [Longimicrobium sp.]
MLTTAYNCGSVAIDHDAAGFLELVSGRRGHFRLESGHHGGLWLDLDPLFTEPARVDPFVARLTEALRPHAADVVCGPLLGGAFLAQLVARELGVAFCFTERVTVTGDGALFGARYRLPPAFAPRVRGRRVAMVDDVMSAGSALRGTFAELRAHGAVPVAAGALMVLGSAGADFFAQRGIPVEAAARDEYPLWLPSDCPLCAAGVPLEDVTATMAGDDASGA